VTGGALASRGSSPRTGADPRRVALALALAVLVSSECDAPTGDAEVELSALEGAEYLPARAITHTYCGPCHIKDGKDPDQPRAYRGFKLDSYDQMKRRLILVRNAITVHGTHADMPPPRAKRQPSAAERQVLVDWVERGCPNTPDGF
jgi:uncharacterized membrane protein